MNKFLSSEWMAEKPARPWIVSGVALCLGVAAGCLIMWGVNKKKGR